MKTAMSTLCVFYTAAIIGCAADPSPSVPQGTADDAQMQELLREFPEATQIDDHSIGWDDGKVVLVLPRNGDAEIAAEDPGTDPAAVADLSPALANPHACPSGWYCVYQDSNWGGRRLQFSDCTRNDLSNFGFRDQTSSWVNNGSLTVQVKNDLTLQPDQVLWTMAPQSLSSFVGAANNDKADFFQCP